MPHLALLGDSIFDNEVYTRGEPSVIEHLRALQPKGWRSTLCAVDGATTRSLLPQLKRVPEDATHLIVSIGGNDALMNSDVLTMPASSVAGALGLLAERAAGFEQDYRAALQPVLNCGLPTILCTIYNGNLEPERAAAARIALIAFNDVILRVAAEQRLNVIELRIICTEPEDYANPIEPSGAGGQKIARAIVDAVQGRLS